jgi:hypothetical protein
VSVIVDLVALYEDAGFEVQSSLSPAHFPDLDPLVIPFTYMFREDGYDYHPQGQMTAGGGIAFSEICFLEALCEAIRPKSVFVIGNAFGWSTLALGLINPTARVVAIDICWRMNEVRGLEVTNVLGKRAGLDVRALKGESPRDVAPICAREFDGPVDLVFVDGGHVPEQQTLDFNACREVGSADCVYVFHDVVNFKMIESFLDISRSSPALAGSLLMRTPSGMAICYPRSRAAELAPVIRAFGESQENIRAIVEAGAP